TDALVTNELLVAEIPSSRLSFVVWMGMALICWAITAREEAVFRFCPERPCWRDSIAPSLDTTRFSTSRPHCSAWGGRFLRGKTSTIEKPCHFYLPVCEAIQYGLNPAVRQVIVKLLNIVVNQVVICGA